jgi:hypothetical protein
MTKIKIIKINHKNNNKNGNKNRNKNHFEISYLLQRQEAAHNNSSSNTQITK